MSDMRAFFGQMTDSQPPGEGDSCRARKILRYEDMAAKADSAPFGEHDSR
jgi:hypothetical protein